MPKNQFEVVLSNNSSKLCLLWFMNLETFFVGLDCFKCQVIRHLAQGSAFDNECKMT